MTAAALADTVFDLVLCGLLLATALAALSRQPLFGAVIFFIVYGVFAAIAWLRLGATDVALAEAAIGAGLTGVLLLGALARLSPPDRSGTPRPGVAEGLAALAAGGVALGLGWAFLSLPEANGLQQAVAGNLGQSGSENPVTAVLLNFRAWDTLLESIVLLAALLGVWALSDDAAWGGQPGLRHHTRPGGVLASFGRLLPPIGLLVGIYLVWAGTHKPGGAFQGGTVLAAVWLLVAMAGLLRAPRVSAPGLRAALIAGPAMFLALGLAGGAAGAFLTLPPDHAKAMIVAIEVTLTLSIAVTLAALVLGPPETGEQGP